MAIERVLACDVLLLRNYYQHRWPGFMSRFNLRRLWLVSVMHTGRTLHIPLDDRSVSTGSPACQFASPPLSVFSCALRSTAACGTFEYGRISQLGRALLRSFAKRSHGWLAGTGCLKCYRLWQPLQVPARPDLPCPKSTRCLLLYSLPSTEPGTTTFNMLPDPEELQLPVASPSLVLSVKEEAFPLGPTSNFAKSSGPTLRIFAEAIKIDKGGFEANRNVELYCCLFQVAAGDDACIISTSAAAAEQPTAATKTQGDGDPGANATADAKDIVLSIEDVVSLTALGNLQVTANGGAGGDGQASVTGNGGKGGDGTDAGTISVIVGFGVL